jgi:hypothetical protein
VQAAGTGGRTRRPRDVALDRHPVAALHKRAAARRHQARRQRQAQLAASASTVSPYTGTGPALRRTG